MSSFIVKKTVIKGVTIKKQKIYTEFIKAKMLATPFEKKISYF